MPKACHTALAVRCPHGCPNRSPRGFECTVAVEDLDAIAAAVVANGGTVTLSGFEIVSVGKLLTFLDTEGNICNAMVYDTSPY